MFDVGNRLRTVMEEVKIGVRVVDRVESQCMTASRSVEVELGAVNKMVMVKVKIHIASFLSTALEPRMINCVARSQLHADSSLCIKIKILNIVTPLICLEPVRLRQR